MIRHPSFAIVVAALLNNLASGFYCSTAIPLPTSAFARLPNSRNKDVQRLQNGGVSADIFSTHNDALVVRGGGPRASTSISNNDSNEEVGHDLNLTPGKVVVSLWGTCGVAYILIKAVKRVFPIALEPFSKGADVVPLTQFQLAAYILTSVWFAYVEGYKGFQLKFSPLVVARSFTLQPSSPIHHLLLAPFYSMGLFHATKKRMIVSWSVSIGVAVIVAAVKRLPYPWRNIVDAGVVVGLTWGCVSMLGGYLISLVSGIAPIDVDPALPENKA